MVKKSGGEDGSERGERLQKAEKILRETLSRGDPLPDKHWACGLTTHSVLRRIAEQSTPDKETREVLLIEAEGFRRALAREHNLKTVLERMIADRIVLSYQRLLLLEAYTDIEHEPGANTHEHLDLHRKLVARESAEFLRNVRALKDLKTVPLRLMIKDAGQVNVGQQQVNVTDSQQVDKARQAGEEALNAERSETQAPDSTQAQEDVE